MRFVLGLAGSIDHEEQVAAEIRHHQIVENAAILVGKLRVALPPRRNRHDVLRHQPFQRQRGVRTLPDFGRSTIWPICETSNRPAEAGMQMFPQHAGGVLHWHFIAGERHHLAAAAR